VADDLDTILRLRDEAARWIAATGSDQWQTAWPTADGQAERIADSIAAGQTWMLRVGDDVAGTVAVDEYANPALWTPAECAEPAFYVHRLIVTRAYGGRGLGAFVLDWWGDRAAETGKRWIRVDVWTTNHRLREYYTGQHFTHVRTIHSDYPSGALSSAPPCPGVRRGPARSSSGTQPVGWPAVGHHANGAVRSVALAQIVTVMTGFRNAVTTAILR